MLGLVSDPSQLNNNNNKINKSNKKDKNAKDNTNLGTSCVMNIEIILFWVLSSRWPEDYKVNEAK